MELNKNLNDQMKNNVETPIGSPNGEATPGLDENKQLRLVQYIDNLETKIRRRDNVITELKVRCFLYFFGMNLQIMIFKKILQKNTRWRIINILKKSEHYNVKFVY